MSPVALPTHHALVLHGAKDLRYEQRTLWPPHQGQVQVQVVSTGLCGSDLHYYLHGRNGDFALQSPLVLGHESSGVVTAIGPGVKNFYIGQKVAIEAGIMCNECSYCLKGRYNLCKNMRFASSAKTFPHLDGTLQERFNHPAGVLHPLPEGCTFDQAALAEPLSVLLHAFRRAGLTPPSSLSQHLPSSALQTFFSTTSASSQNPISPSPTSSSSSPTSSSSPSSSPSTSSPSSTSQGPTILVFGVGAIGLLACLLAKTYGASLVCAIDINASRLAFAKKEGFADFTFCLPPPPSASSSQPQQQQNQKGSQDEQLRRAKENVMNALAEFRSGEGGLVEEGFDYVFECTGAEACVQMSVYAATTGGKVLLIGMGTRNLNLPLSAAALREVDIQGSFRYSNTYPLALALLGSGRLNVGSSGSLGSSSSSANGSSSGTVGGGGDGVVGGGGIEKIISHRFPLSEAKKAFELLARGRDEDGGMVLKVMIDSD
ncbi:chaperonin 10-like protein [Abortiporus biennis]|nr:chaperonin 10-like protein [Abortiporus biennis]